MPYRNTALCWKCFRRDVVERVKLEIVRWKLFDKNHRLLAAVSGGKDSFTLLSVLAEVHDPSKIVAVTVVEGIEGGYHVEEARRLSRYAREFGIDYIVVSFKEFYGVTLAELVAESRRKGLGVKPCTFCGVLRRRILNRLAKQVGVDRVVTAHNLDDEAQTVIMNIVRGDIVGLARQHPIASLEAGREFVPRVKPLRKIYEWETTVYAFKSGYPIPQTECPYLKLDPTLRLSIRLKLYEIEWAKPGTLLRLLETFDLLVEPLARKYALKHLPLCERCGEPTSPGRRICKACELLEKAGIAT